MSSQQLLFDGYELEAVDVDINGIGTKPIGSLGIAPDALHSGDIVEATVRYKVAWVNHGNGIDAEGMGKDEFRRVYKLLPVKSSFKVTSHLTKAQQDAEWSEAHGATG